MNVERMFVVLANEKERYQNEVDPLFYQLRSLQTKEELNKTAREEIALFESMMDEDGLVQKFYEITKCYRDINFRGKIIIKPFDTLISAMRDGIMGVYDSGYTAASMIDEGFLFSIRFPGKEDKAFGYVLYGHNGEILKARQAFGLDITNSTILNYLELFSRDVLLPALREKEQTA